MLGMLVREHGDTLTDQELTAICGLLLLAGHETTSGMLGLGTLALLRHPDQLAAMRDDPELSQSGDRRIAALPVGPTPFHTAHYDCRRRDLWSDRFGRRTGFSLTVSGQSRPRDVR